MKLSRDLFVLSVVELQLGFGKIEIQPQEQRIKIESPLYHIPVLWSDGQNAGRLLKKVERRVDVVLENGNWALLGYR